MADWLQIHRGDAPLIVSFPHTGTDIPATLEARLVSPARARKDADWWVHKLYDFASSLGATTVRTTISRTVIDVNRDPSGASLYPGQTTTELCPTTTFDGEALYVDGRAPGTAEIAERRRWFFDPYHSALADEIERLRQRHAVIVLYDAHSIRSRVPRLFAGLLPHFNIGTYGGRSCAPALTASVEAICDQSPFSRVTNGRFQGGWITRHYGDAGRNVHAIQMELAYRGYLDEPAAAGDEPPSYDETRASAMRAVLQNALQACLAFAHSSAGTFE
jgi:formiminoglutamase